MHYTRQQQPGEDLITLRETRPLITPLYTPFPLTIRYFSYNLAFLNTFMSNDPHSPLPLTTPANEIPYRMRNNKLKIEHLNISLYAVLETLLDPPNPTPSSTTQTDTFYHRSYCFCTVTTSSSSYRTKLFDIIKVCTFQHALLHLKCDGEFDISLSSEPSPLY